MSEEKFTASGGWCAPSETVYNVGTDWAALFPKVSVQRGGITFDFHRTPEDIAAAESWYKFVGRVIEMGREIRDRAIDEACVVALANGWDIHVYEPPEVLSRSSATQRDLVRLRRIGIEFTPAKHPIPTIHHHHTSEYDDFYDEDF